MAKVKASLWRGRLVSSMHPVAREFLSSFSEDADLADIDIDVAEAHAIALARSGLFRPAELGRVLRAYERARTRVAGVLARRGGAFHDIHPVVEKMVSDACGEEVGGRVHLGKSRNDQVAADICIFCRRKVLGVLEEVGRLEMALVDAAKRMAGELFPAHTHGRPAQPTTADHFLESHAEALERDAARLLAARSRLSLSPLGGAAVAGTSVPVRRRLTARLLGFSGIWPNALDATSARDHVLELQAALAVLQSDLSRLAGDLIFLSGEPAGVLEYPDEMADTSSAMPQKKNPDPLELVRARAATMGGRLAGALGVVSGLPSGYSRDLQELKAGLWWSLATARESAAVVRLVVERIKVNRPAAERLLEGGHAAALDLAETLCLRKGVAFRRAHYAVGRLVQALVRDGRTLSQAGAAEASRVLSGAAGRNVSFTAAEWLDAVDLDRGAARRRDGGPGDARALVRAMAERCRGTLRAVRSLAAAELRARRLLRSEVRRRLRRR